MNRIICLDIDDCIFLNNNTYIGVLDDDLKILEINLERLKKIIEKFDCKIFITSSWYSILKLENNNIIYDNKGYGLPGKILYEKEYQAFKLLEKYLNGFVIGLSCGDRETDIKNLLKNENNKIIAFDDIDLSKIEGDNYLFLYTNGLITNHHLFKIFSFLK